MGLGKGWYLAMTLPDERVDELIRVCGGNPPDYTRFYLELDEIMCSGIGPRSFCMVLVGKLRQVIKTAEAFSKSHPGVSPSDVDDATKSDLFIAYNGYRLLLGSIQHLPKEMQDFILRTVGEQTMGG